MKNYLTLIVLFVVINIGAQTVSNNAELQNAISSATAGSTITLTDGVWNDITISINKTGTVTNPITIKAQNIEQVFLEGNPRISLGGAYIIFEGFVFQNPSNLVTSSERIEPIIEFRDSSNNECNNCTVSNIKIDSFNGTAAQETDTFKWVIIYGQNNEISHSSFVGKHGVGSIINDNRNDTNPDYSKIHHNYFAERTPVGGTMNTFNDQDAIRIGNSATSLDDSFTEIYDNLFFDWVGEVEIISVKSGKNKLYNNTFSDYSGTLTLRHGNGSEVYSNYFFADNNLFSGGIRVIGEDHKIYNNYIEAVNSEKPDGSTTGTAGAINISNGRENTLINGYYQVKNATIVNNTFVNCDYGVRMGTTVGSTTIAPENVIIANNIMINSSVKGVDEITAPIGTSIYEGNINQNGNWDLTDGVNSNQTVASGLLLAGTDFYMVPVGSAAIDTGIGTYSFLTTDILGSTRPSSFDAGAEEYGGSGTNNPYKVTDVGTKIGFLSAPSAFISLSTNQLNFNIDSGSLSFDINSNIDWTISDDAGWLSLNTTVGSNGATIIIDVTQNSTGSERTAIVAVTQSGVGISSTLTVIQSAESFTATAITGIIVTGVGTQDPNIPENTLDGDITSRWSAQASDGSAYLTYDLQCKKTVTSVNIYFHKGNIRTSSFKISTSSDGINFTDATTIIKSSGSTVGFEEFPISPNLNVQYIRIFGFGNSEGSGWNSYEEVEIHGNNSCSALSISDNALKNNQIIIYPVPTSNGSITITSNIGALGVIKIFNIQGSLLKKQVVESNTTKVDISKFSSGVYILKTNNDTKRFVVK